MAQGSVAWSECVTGDVEAAKAHYSALLGWTFDGIPMPSGTYWLAKSGDTVVAGMMALSDLQTDREIPPHWMTYLEVADIDAAVTKAAETGGSVVTPPFPVPGVGRIAMIADPGGALAGYLQPE